MDLKPNDDVDDDQVKRKEPQELEEEVLKRPRPSTPPDEDAEGLLRPLMCSVCCQQ